MSSVHRKWDTNIKKEIGPKFLGGAKTFSAEEKHSCVDF